MLVVISSWHPGIFDRNILHQSNLARASTARRRFLNSDLSTSRARLRTYFSVGSACVVVFKRKSFSIWDSTLSVTGVDWIWNSVFQFCPSGGQYLRKTGVYPCSYGRFWLL